MMNLCRRNAEGDGSRTFTPWATLKAMVWLVSRSVYRKSCEVTFNSGTAAAEDETNSIRSSPPENTLEPSGWKSS
jgi:hypothetical protein